MNEPFQWSRVVCGAPQWAWAAGALAAIAGASLVAAYRRADGRPSVRWAAGILKATAFLALAVCLLEPQYRGRRVRPGANLFVVLADNSQSVALRDESGAGWSSQVRAILDRQPWQTRLGQDFEVRRYVFDQRLRAVSQYDEESLGFRGEASRLAGALRDVGRRFAHRPLAGILLLSDGNATDPLETTLNDVDLALPPVYPILPKSSDPAPDVAVRRVTVRQTNFEAAPVVVRGEVVVRGLPATTLTARLMDEQDETIDSQTLATPDARQRPATLPLELRARPDAAGLHVYRVEVLPVANPSAMGGSRKSAGLRQASAQLPPAAPREATLANNQRLAIVHRRECKHRLLYLSGGRIGNSNFSAELRRKTTNSTWSEC